ncbi:MAG: Yip1 family protein [Pseudomonadota bacterium]
MTFWLDLMKLTVADPKSGAERLLSIDLSREAIWSLLAAVVALSVISAWLMNGLLPNGGQPDVMSMRFMSSPLMFALVMWGLLVLTVFCTHYIGQMFGGVGHFNDSLKLVTWLQAILLVVQIGQLIIALVSPALAAFVGLAIGLYSIWVFVMFVSVLHDFESRFMVFVAMLGVMLGLIFGLSLIVGLIATLFGVELPNA